MQCHILYTLRITDLRCRSYDTHTHSKRGVNKFGFKSDFFLLGSNTDSVEPIHTDLYNNSFSLNSFQWPYKLCKFTCIMYMWVCTWSNEWICWILWCILIQSNTWQHLGKLHERILTSRVLFSFRVSSKSYLDSRIPTWDMTSWSDKITG